MKQKILKRVVREIIEPWEGGFVNDPQDPGGATKYGITIDTLSDYLGRDATVAEVKMLDRSAAQEIYRRNYWIPANCERVPDGIAPLLFDGAINTGVEQATYDLQQAVGATEDGIFGPQTEKMVRQAFGDNPEGTVRDYAAARAEFYALLDDLDDRFGYGWMRRLFDCYTLSHDITRGL